MTPTGRLFLNDSGSTIRSADPSVGVSEHSEHINGCDVEVVLHSSSCRPGCRDSCMFRVATLHASPAPRRTRTCPGS